MAKSKVASGVLGSTLPFPRADLIRPLRTGESAVFAYSSSAARKLAGLVSSTPANFSGSRQLLVDPASGTTTVVLVAHCIAPLPPERPAGRRPKKGSLSDRILDLEAQIAELLSKESQICTSSASNSATGASTTNSSSSSAPD